MVHGFATVVIDCNFRKVITNGLQDSTMCVGHIYIAFLIHRMKLKFQNIFRHIGWVSYGGIVCVGGVGTDVIIGEFRFTICCGGHGCGDSQRLHSGWYYGYGWTRMDI